MRFLAPIVLSVARDITYINGIDVVRKLETYVADGHLKSTTKFITADVIDLYTMIPRKGALEALARFCIKHSKQGKIGTFSVDYIMKMARLILDTNYFAYNQKYYKQIRGGAMGSAFTQRLANIYMREWEQDLIKYQTSRHEIYGRYIDDIFMKTNQTIDEIKVELQKADNKDINININYRVHALVDFLDVTIANEDSQLRTYIYHKSAAEPYILPYTSDHPHHIRRNIPYTALLRTARICSNVNDFNLERVRIDVSLSLNGYSPKFISKQFKRFFGINNATSVINHLDKHTYHKLHQTLLYQQTRRENELNKMMIDTVASSAVLQPKIWNHKFMHPHYIYSCGQFIDLPEEFCKWWKTYYVSSVLLVHNTQIGLIPDIQRTIENLFIHKKPPREILNKMQSIQTHLPTILRPISVHLNQT